METQISRQCPKIKKILVASTRLYKPLCWSVGPSVAPSVGLSLFTKHATYGDLPCFLLFLPLFYKPLLPVGPHFFEHTQFFFPPPFFFFFSSLYSISLFCHLDPILKARNRSLYEFIVVSLNLFSRGYPAAFRRFSGAPSKTAF